MERDLQLAPRGEVADPHVNLFASVCRNVNDARPRVDAKSECSRPVKERVGQKVLGGSTPDAPAPTTHKKVRLNIGPESLAEDRTRPDDLSVRLFLVQRSHLSRED